ncbi:MAG: 4,5-DOPA dioxygenase extradiol [Saprospiraceae bacterium]
MKRIEFITSMLGLSAISSIRRFGSLSAQLKNEDRIMPVLFVGHGNPMNAIEDNEFSRTWIELGKSLPLPKAILCISAHWETKGTYVTAMEKPKTIHDFGGFPQALYDVEYPAPGSKWLADETKNLVHSTTVELDNSWGLDHGCWSVLKRIFPNADIPIIQLSLDYTKNAQHHFALAKELKNLRNKGVLIIGSGNMVHNFQYARWDAFTPDSKGLDWAIEANEQFKKLIIDRDFQPLIDYKKQGVIFQLSAPTPEHFLPMLYSLSLVDKKDKVSFFNDAITGGSFSMTSIKVEQS